uniref:AB hydrolase-1 domain-containing protein n=2 Tax=Rhodnius prolixus TaxID=13249 RepID=A0A905QWQ5_RHOPR
MIDHIRLATGHKRVFYVGYSLGGTVFFVACSSRPAVNEKIRAGVVIAPYMFTPVHLNKVLQLTIRIIFSVMRQWRTLRVFEVFPRSNATLAINQLFCEPKSRLMPLCLQLYDHVFGLTQELNENLLLDVMSTFRAGSSAKTLYHCAQVMYSNSLKYYDYEPEENLKRYGQTEPPDYDLSRVTAPVSLHYSLQDWFVNAENVDKLAERLPHLIGKFVVPSQSFNHIDFMVGKHARELVYDEIFNIISKF